MSEYWKHQNLEGNGLQTINQQYARLSRNTKIAYILCLFFPFGLHQFYLKSFVRASLFLSLSMVAVGMYTTSPLISSIFLLTEIILLAVDVFQIDKRVIDFNKNLKMNLSLQINSAAPKDFQGRYHDDSPIDDYLSLKNNEVTAFETKENKTTKNRVYSFAEQEKLLKEMAKKK